MKKAPFHISLPCKSIGKTEDFYLKVIGATLGRHSSLWLDIDLFGNQITFTKSGTFDFINKSYKFEDTVLPSFHFGIIVDKETLNGLYERLKYSNFGLTGKLTFLKNKIGEHVSFFFARSQWVHRRI